MLNQIAKGDKSAFEKLYTLYKNKVYNTAIGYLQNIEEAEEITQDVFLSIYQKADTFKGNSKVSTWIYRITINKSLNYLEKRNRRPKSDKEIQDSHRVDFVHPGVMLENQEKSKYIFTVIDTLIDSQKTAFLLYFVEELPQKEIADIMNVSVKSVESLLQRAKVKLREKLLTIYPEGNQKNNV